MFTQPQVTKCAVYLLPWSCMCWDWGWILRSCETQNVPEGYSLQCFQDWPTFQGSYLPDYHILEDIAQEMVPTLAPGISLGPSALPSCGSRPLL